MKHLIIAIFISLFLFSCNSIQDRQAEKSQPTSEKTDLSNQLTNAQSDDHIIFLDGEKVSKYLIVNFCLDYTKKEGLDEIIIADNYCNCFAERLGENFKSTEVSFLLKNIESEKELYSAAIKFYNLPVVKKIAEDCIKDNLTDSNENFSISSEEEKEALITVFKNALKTQEGYEELKQLINIDDFCECVVVKILDNFSYKEIMTDPNFGENPKYIQIQEDCMFKHKKEPIY